MVIRHFYIVLLVFTSYTLCEDLSLEDPLVEEENILEITEIITPLLSGPTWRTALSDLHNKESDPTLSPATKATASHMLGNFYAGLVPAAEGTFPPINLSKAFGYYISATKQPNPFLPAAQYMVSFILTYHPEAAPETYQNFEVSTPKPKETTNDETIPTKKEADSSSDQPIRQNVPLALIYQQFAASGQSLEAQASLAHKLFYGHHTPTACRKAVELFQQAALSQVQGMSFKPSIQVNPGHALLAEEYKSGQSLLQEEEDIVFFHTYNAENGNVDSQIAISLIYLEGGIGGLEKDEEKAFYYMDMACQTEKDNPIALTHLGYYYAHGIGVEQDNETAVDLFRKAYEKGSAEAATQLGLMTLHGWGTPKSRSGGFQLLDTAATENEQWALLNLGRFAFHGQHGVSKHVANARSYFQRSAQQGNLVATYNLALITQHGMGIVPSCSLAVGYYKKVLERTIYKTLTASAFLEFSLGRFERSLIRYELAADQGSIVGQQNAAWLYEMDFGTDFLGTPTSPQEPQKNVVPAPPSSRYLKAFRFYQMAAEQQSAEAHLKLGDFKYYGLGTDSDISMAAQYYKLGSDLRSPQAAFNIGYMHQKGLGLPRDFHLAKRYYDLAMDMSKEAYVPSLLALVSLGFEYALDYLVVEGLIWGYKWDTVVLVILSVSLALSLVVRHFLVTAIAHQHDHLD